MSAALLAAVLVFVLVTFGPTNLVGTASALSPSTLLILFLAVLANAIIASIRLKVISTDVGHPIGLRNAIAAVSAGSIGGMLFFQVAGQLMARGAVLSRHGLEFPTVVVITAYERAVSAILSGLLAMAGAYHVFGQIMVDDRSGGAVFLKLLSGLIAAATVAGLIGYGRQAAKAMAPFMTQRFATRFVRSIVLSLAVQLPMMAAYVIAVRAMSPGTPIADLAAASAIVMFAASVPISLAGWGVREMSAVLALGAIGVGADQAFVAAATVGFGSLAAMALLAAVSSRAWLVRRREAAPREAGLDYGKALAWGIPLATAVLIFFQLHLPVRSTTVNVNLADPLAILGIVLFGLMAWHRRSAPQWRLPCLNLALCAMTLVLTFALLLGAAKFGWTTWAVTNKYAGWFMLLGFAMTGALIVMTSGEGALRILLLSFAGAAASIAALDILLTFVAAIGYRFPEEVIPSPIVGFAQNRNAFAFQLLMAITATLTAGQGRVLRVMLLGFALAGMCLCGSRAGWITLPFLFAAALYMRATTLREISLALGVAGALVSAIGLAPYLIPGADGNVASRSLAVFALPEETSTDERLRSWFGAWHLFVASPIWGAGLGAYVQESTEAGRALVIHSSVLWLLAEMGLVGLTIFIVPAVASLVSELRRPGPDLAGKVIVFCIVAFAIMSAAHEMIYQRSLWFLLGAAMACLPEHRVIFSRSGAAAEAKP